MKDMLSEALAEIGRLLNQLVTNLTGEDENKRAEWLAEFKKFLRKEACWAGQVAQQVAQTVVAGISVLIIDCKKSLDEMRVACAFDDYNTDITAKRFPITAEDEGEWEYDLWDPEGNISSDSAVKGMKGEDKDNPWIPARIAHLLAFAAKHPDAQRKNPIVALGSVARVGGGRCVPYLSEDGSLRVLFLPWWDDDWFASCRFLRVRKLKKS